MPPVNKHNGVHIKFTTTQWLRTHALHFSSFKILYATCKESRHVVLARLLARTNSQNEGLQYTVVYFITPSAVADYSPWWALASSTTLLQFALSPTLPLQPLAPITTMSNHFVRGRPVVYRCHVPVIFRCYIVVYRCHNIRVSYIMYGLTYI